jgi:formylglycine-generating enzyme required for sulfatase activity
VFIETGTFTMGSPRTEEDRAAEESPQTVVRISSGFWMGKYSVTQAEYQNLMGINPSFFTPDNGYTPDLSRPVEQVTWDDASNYCVTRTQLDLAAGRIPANCVYRLPTEAEYEYAYRAGTTTRFPYGDDLNYTMLTNYEWYSDNSGGMTHPVGQKLPNPWGLYDMAGNVGNWCQDWHDTLPGGNVVDPWGPASGVENQSGPGSPAFHVVRVAGWDGFYWACRSAFRSVFNPGESNATGFRVVLAPAR